MSQIDVNRSVQFVSLDTHPANNALVVTYEISVGAFDRSNGQELRRGSKRHQFQIKIKALDELKEEHLTGEKMIINLESLGKDILSKCKLLEQQRLEEIQLHLLYLVNRRRAQIAVNLHQSVERETSGPILSRPSSRLSHRVSRLSAGSIRTSNAFLEPSSSDLYMNYMIGEQQNQFSIDGLIGSFLVELDEHLQHTEKFLNDTQKTVPSSKTDSQIEALYGGEEERKVAIASIRCMCRDDSTFSGISSHRLLVCALLRALGIDSQLTGTTSTSKLSILFCLIRYTMFTDVFLSLSSTSEPVIDVAKPILHQLQHHLNTHFSEDPATASKALPESEYLLINSYLVIVVNLLRMSRKEPKIICPQLTQMLMNTVRTTTDTLSVQSASLTLVDLLDWLTKKLERNLRLLESTKLTTKLLSLTLHLLLQLSVFKEFLGQIRVQSHEKLIDSLMVLLNTVQVNRPQSSGGSLNTSSRESTNTNHQLYMLEMDLMKLVNNLILDRHFKYRLMKRKVLVKCILRSLAMFMASRAGQQSLINQFAGSTVLLMPTRILYEMSCDTRMIGQLYKSKLIIKCLLEYLVSAVSDSLRDQSKSGLSLTEDARSYIVALWINLAFKKEAPIYSDDMQLNELLYEYIHLTIRLIDRQVEANTIVQLPVYIHSKLLRIVTHFMRINEASTSNWFESLTNSTSKLINLLKPFTDEKSTSTQSYEHSLLVECVGTLSNLIDKVSDKHGLFSMMNLVEKLFSQLSKDYTGPQSDMDDLRLVSIVLVAKMARSNEICSREDDGDLISAPLFWEPFEATCNALNSQPIDREMLIWALYALQQLMRHVGFLNQLWPPTSTPSTMESVAIQTSRKLASFMLNGDKLLSKLSVSVLEQINQLEQVRTQQETELVRLTRFETYNEKWISTIQASRRPDLESASLDPLSSPKQAHEEGEEEEVEDEGDDYELSHLRALAFESGQVDELIDNGTENNYDDMDESDFEASGQEEPDMNVIDANSMIKHLTARRELRFARESIQ